MKELFGSIGGEHDDLDEVDEEQEAFMNEPIDRDHLGLTSGNDFTKIHSYFVRIGKVLNRDNNKNPNNPFRVYQQ